jgi:hypothetical protein
MTHSAETDILHAFHECPFRARKMAWMYLHQNEDGGNKASAPPSQRVEQKMQYKKQQHKKLFFLNIEPLLFQ